MTQEVQAILTLEVNTKRTREDIEVFIRDLIEHHHIHSTALTQKNFDISDEFIIKEESEIYKTETVTSVTNCPTCGTECDVGGDTTHYYVPKK